MKIRVQSLVLGLFLGLSTVLMQAMCIGEEDTLDMCVSGDAILDADSFNSQNTTDVSIPQQTMSLNFNFGQPAPQPTNMQLNASFSHAQIPVFSPISEKEIQARFDGIRYVTDVINAAIDTNDTQKLEKILKEILGLRDNPLTSTLSAADAIVPYLQPGQHLHRPLIRAIHNKRPALVALLLKHNAQLGNGSNFICTLTLKGDEKNLNPYLYARFRNDTEILEMIKKRIGANQLKYHEILPKLFNMDEFRKEYIEQITRNRTTLSSTLSSCMPKVLITIMADYAWDPETTEWFYQSAPKTGTPSTEGMECTTGVYQYTAQSTQSTQQNTVVPSNNSSRITGHKRELDGAEKSDRPSKFLITKKGQDVTTAQRAVTNSSMHDESLSQSQSSSCGSMQAD